MNQKKLITIALIILIVFIAVDVLLYFVFFKGFEFGKEITQEAEAVETINFEPSPGLAGVYYKEEALKKNSLEECLKNDNLRNEEKCIKLIEETNIDQAENASYCLEHNDINKEFACIRDFANKNNNPSQCELIGGIYNTMCYDYYAKNRVSDGDVSICNLIPDDSRKNECINQVYFYSGECDKIIDEGKRDICLIESPSI